MIGRLVTERRFVPGWVTQILGDVPPGAEKAKRSAGTSDEM